MRLVTVPGVFAPISDSWMLARAVREEVRARLGGGGVRARLGGGGLRARLGGEEVRARLGGGGLRPRVLDVCTGSGAIAVSAALAGAEATAVDVSRRAVACARVNALLNGTRVRALRGDLLAPVAGERFDVIASNPPYVPGRDVPVRGARRAWDAGRDGRALLDRLLDEAPAHLAPGGVLLLVHSDLIDAERTLGRLRAAGLEAEVAVRERGPLGPLMRTRAREGLLPAGTAEEEVLVLRGRA